MRVRLASWNCPACAWGDNAEVAHSLLKETQSSVNNKSHFPFFLLFFFLQLQVQQSLPSRSDTPVSLPEGMVVDSVGPGAILGLLQNTTFYFLYGVQSKLKGDESRTLLPAVDDVPAAGRLWGKVTGLRTRELRDWIHVVHGCVLFYVRVQSFFAVSTSTATWCSWNPLPINQILWAGSLHNSFEWT